jgi:hypothetical protein
MRENNIFLKMKVKEIRKSLLSPFSSLFESHTLVNNQSQIVTAQGPRHSLYCVFTYVIIEGDRDPKL